MIYTNFCCAKNHYNKYFVNLIPVITEITDKIKVNELFGKDDGGCGYNELNDHMYLKEQLDVHLHFRSNGEFIDPDDYCFDKAYDYFFDKGFDIEEQLKIFGIERPYTVTA